jgi:hypothetical protein
LYVSESATAVQECGSNTVLLEGCAEVRIFFLRYGNPWSSIFVEVAWNFTVSLNGCVSIIRAEELAILSLSYRQGKLTFMDAKGYASEGMAVIGWRWSSEGIVAEKGRWGAG